MSSTQPVGRLTKNFGWVSGLNNDPNGDFEIVADLNLQRYNLTNASEVQTTSVCALYVDSCDAATDLNIGTQINQDVNIGKAGTNVVIDAASQLKVNTIKPNGAGPIIIDGLSNFYSPANDVEVHFGDVNGAPPTSNTSVHLEGNGDVMALVSGGWDGTGSALLEIQNKQNEACATFDFSNADDNLHIEASTKDTRAKNDIEFIVGGQYAAAPALGDPCIPVGGSVAMTILGASAKVDVSNELIISSAGGVKISNDGTANSAGALSTTIAVGSGTVCTGANSIAIGSGAKSVAAGDISVGLDANKLRTAGSASNIAIGALAMNTAGVASFNTVVGGSGLASVTTGSSNSAIGYLSGIAISTGNQNTTLGASAGTTISTGSGNVIAGISSNVSAGGTSNAVAIGNTAVTGTGGVSIGNTATSGTGGISIGDTTNVVDADGIAIGRAAVSRGAGSIAIGLNSGIDRAAGSVGNVSIGSGSFAGDGIASNNTAVGVNSLAIATTAGSCVAIGHGAGSAITTAGLNTFVGANAGNVSNGFSNVCVGESSNVSAAGVLSSVAVGKSSTAGSNAIAVGASSTCAGNSVALGYGANVAHSATICLGRDAVSTAANQLVIGSAGYPINTAATATAGAGALPANPVSFLPIHLNGTTYKLPLYNV